MAAGKPPLIAIRALVAATLLSLLLACSVPPVTERDIPPLRGQSPVAVDDVDLLAVSEEMRQFVDSHASPNALRTKRAFSLAYAALDPYLLSFDYDPGITLTAEEAFRRRQGNCLTFSSLFVALAREAGLNAWYQEVKIPPEWNAVNETMLVSMHVNAVVEERGYEYVVDVTRRKGTSLETKQKISDLEAKAQYYNNLGAEALVANDLVLAYAYFKAGLKAHPGLEYIWSNLGVVYRRNEQVEDAKFAYRTALEFEPRHTVSLNNLYLIYEDEGNFEAAEEMRSRVEKNRRGNPYYLHHLAEVANEEERYTDAIQLLRRALRLENREYRFYYTLAQTQYRMGNIDSAQASLDRARELAPSAVESSLLTLPDGSL